MTVLDSYSIKNWQKNKLGFKHVDKKLTEQSIVHYL